MTTQPSNRDGLVCCRWQAAGSLGLTLALALATVSAAAGELQQRFDLLRPQLAESPFGVPLHMESSEQDGRLRGTVFAVVERPFVQIAAALGSSRAWCDVLLLHPNVTGCRTGGDGGERQTIHVDLGRKGSELGDDATSIDFQFALAESTPRGFVVRLAATEGPLATRDYLLELAAAPALSSTGQSYVQLSYAYAYGTAARLVMNAYLQTRGRDKVGFTVTGLGPDGAPIYVDGLRGVLERNTMRYYLAVDTVLASGTVPEARRRAWRFNAWFDATERYRPQLHELTKAEYLASKQAERQVRVPDSTDSQ